MESSQEPIGQASDGPTEGVNLTSDPPVMSASNTSATPTSNTSATPASNTSATATPTSNTPVTSTSDSPAPNNGVVDTSKLKSDVWQHMTKVLIDGLFKAVCKYCGNKLAAGPNSGTKHIRAHIDSCLSKKQQTFPKAFQKMLVARKDQEGKTKIKSFAFDQEGSRKDLVEMIVLHEHPLSIVNQVGFKNFVGNLQPLFKMPTRNTVRRDIFRQYMTRIKKTMALIDHNEGMIAITTDMWTADHQKKSYMAVTAHFVDDQWHLQQRLLRFQHVPSPHTIEVLVEHLMDVLLDWNLDNKLSTITVDNCSTNDGVVDTLVHKLNAEQLLLGGSVLHMRCCAHILNLIVKDGLDTISQSLEKIRNSYVFWSSTPKKIEKFEETARQLRINSTKKLCYDVKTRWNSTFIMLETAIIYKDVFHRLKLRDAQYKFPPSEEDWSNAKMISEKLKIFYTITELFSGSKYTTANHYFKNICEIRLALVNWVTDSNLTIANMATKMLAKYEKYWSKIHGIMGIATLLDPRFKMDLIVYYYEKIYGVNHESEVEKIVALCRQLIQEYQRRAINENVDELIEGDSAGGGDVPDDFDLFTQRRKKRRVDGGTKLDHYLEEELVPRVNHFNVLTWWMSNGPKFATLRKIARDIYAIPVSTVASESAFSMGGRIISPQRNRLHPKLVEALACVQNWLRAEFEDLGDHNPFKTYCDDSDEDEDQSDCSALTDDVEVAARE